MGSIKSKKGFTLVELLVAMAVTGIVMVGVYSAYYTQQKSYVTQEQVAGMQQNIRAAMSSMERDIRLAGYDPTGSSGVSISGASSSSFQFTYDYDGDGLIGSGESINYQLYTTGEGIQALRRTPGGSALAEHIDALDFVYLDKDGNPTTTTSDIRAVQVTLVARTARVSDGYTDTTVYRNQQNTPIYTPSGANVEYRRRMLQTEIRCRNLGLE